MKLLPLMVGDKTPVWLPLAAAERCRASEAVMRESSADDFFS